MNVVEVFKSIDGEGARTGAPAIFIRFAGCNLRCEYCDTAYAFTTSDADPKYSSAKRVAHEVLMLSVKGHVNNITITGGEPLIHIPEVLKVLECLADTGVAYEVNIETNGTICPNEFIRLYNSTMFSKIDGNSLFFTFDLKTASAGVYEMDMCLFIENMQPKFYHMDKFKTARRSVVKAVVGSIEDLEYVRKIYINGAAWADNFDWYVSPVFGAIEPKELVEFVLRNTELNAWKVQVQLHKIIWDPAKRGV